MKLVIAGGGTGGHVFPGIAIAQALLKIDPNSQILFVGTQRGIEKTAIPKAGFHIEFIDVAGIKGHSVKKILSSLFKLPAAIFASLQILKNHHTDVVIGIGGYASGPVLLSAWLMRIPIAICEPNSVPGLTNIVLGYLSKRIFGGFQKTGEHFSKRKFLFVGNPLREEFQSTTLKPHTVPLITIVGGSLGAHVFNEVVPKALALLKQANFQFNILHQTGRNNEEQVRKHYEKLNIKADVRAFIDDMLAVYEQSDIFISRSGAAACAEIAAVGVASILIPFPYAIYNHQTQNANELASAHAAILLQQDQMTAKRLANEIQSLLSDEQHRFEMAKRARQLGRLDAANQIALAALGRFND